MGILLMLAEYATHVSTTGTNINVQSVLRSEVVEPKSGAYIIWIEFSVRNAHRVLVVMGWLLKLAQNATHVSTRSTSTTANYARKKMASKARRIATTI